MPSCREGVLFPLGGLILIFTPESPSLLKESFPWEVRKIICSFIIMNSNELS